MTMIVLRLLSLLGLKSRFRPPNKPFFRGRGEGCRWIRGLRAQNPCAIGIQPVHTRVDSRGLQWTPANGDSRRTDCARRPSRAPSVSMRVSLPAARPGGVFAPVLTQNRDYIGAMRIPSLRLAGLAGLAMAALAGVAVAQTPVADKPAEKPAVKPVRSIPYVSILGDDGRQRHYETNA